MAHKKLKYATALRLISLVGHARCQPFLNSITGCPLSHTTTLIGRSKPGFLFNNGKPVIVWYCRFYVIHHIKLHDYALR